MRFTRPISDPVHLICRKCGRAGRYRRDSYVEIAGTDNAPDALVRFAAAMGCDRALNAETVSWGDRCGIVYDLEARERGE